jgi:hypothetical protein
MNDVSARETQNNNIRRLEDNNNNQQPPTTRTAATKQQQVPSITTTTISTMVDSVVHTSIKHVHFNPAFEAQDEERSRRRLDRQEEKKVDLCAIIRSKNR